MVYHDPGDYVALIPNQLRSRKYQPGKRTIMLSILLSFMLLMSQLLRAMQLETPHKISNIYVLQSLASLQKVIAPSCMKNYLGEEKEVSSYENTCQHLSSSKDLCSLIHQLFFSHHAQSCDHQSKATFCKSNANEILCISPSECKHLKHFVGSFDEGNAKISWVQIKLEDIEKNVVSKAQENNYKGFVYIRCSNSTDFSEEFGQPQYDSDYEMEFGESYTQLFLFPPYIPKNEISDASDAFNINLLFVDSLSRNHFYRSLPKTINFFEKLREEENIEILDYEYVQAVKHRTYESLEALFTGYVNTTEKTFGTYSMPYKPLRFEDLLSKYKKRGFKTLYLEDMCWSWEWGLIKELKVKENGISNIELWNRLKAALEKANIDEVGPTLASCDILKVNHKKDPFHGLPSVCFNGKYHHEYLLEYLQLYQAKAMENDHPFVTFMQTNVGHEETGIRIQGLDLYLKNYLNFASTLNNTITIMFSDHGNTYGNFIQSSPEAFIETYSPFMFILIPKDVKNKLGDVQLRILQENQHRLVSLVDLHMMLLSLLKEEHSIKDMNYVNKFIVDDGLLGDISLSRTCNDIPILHPNLCICRNFEVPVIANSFHSVLADFSLSVLNNHILLQRKHSGYSGFDACHPLRGVKIRSVNEVRLTTDLTQYKIDILVAASSSKNNLKSEIFFVVVEVGPGSPPGLRLISYDRISLYSKYEKCADKNVELKLCVCNMDEKTTVSNPGFFDSYLLFDLIPGYKDKAKEKLTGIISNFIHEPSMGVKITMDSQYPKENPCIITMIRYFNQGFVLYGANLCPKIHKLDVFINSENLFLSANQHSSHLLHYLDLKMLVSGIVANHKREWNWNHYIKFY